MNPFHSFTTARDIPHNCNPDNDLPTDFSSKRDTYYEALHQPTEADKFIEQLKEDMRKALRSLDGAMPRIRNKVKLLPGRKKPICLSPLDPQPEPRNLLGLKQEVGKRWPMTSLLDMLKEAALRTNFPELLTSVATRERLPREVLHRRLILCLYGLGTNTGFKRLPSADPGTTYSDPLLTLPMPSLKHGEQRSGVRARRPVPPTPRSSGPRTRICSPNGISATEALAS